MPPHSPSPALPRPRWPRSATTKKIGVIAHSSGGARIAAGLAECGHDVVFAGADAGRLAAGDRRGGRLRWTSSTAAAADHGELVVLALATPKSAAGRAPALAEMLAAAIEVARHLRGPAILVEDGAGPITIAGSVARSMSKYTDQTIMVMAGAARGGPLAVRGQVEARC